jgi:hypothetical protein
METQAVGMAGEVCPDCRLPVAPKDWTCPRCGSILARFLFSTVAAKSVTGEDKEAFRAGEGACRARWKESKSIELAPYRPTPGHETAYRAGWQLAASKIKAEGERRKGRRRGLQLLGIGTVLSASAGVVYLGTYPHSIVVWLWISGGLALVFGLVMLISGISDV